MDFFQHQDRARGNTRRLVLLFGAAVITLIAITSLLVAVLLAGTGEGGADFDEGMLLGISLVVITVVSFGSLFRLAQLSAGGKAVAEALNGRLLNLNTRDPDERKVLNVVEEMAIAAGLPVPPVYLMEDPSINAFAAGYRQQDAVIGVTRGCIRQLSRDELQGVVAHEFSHIFNGDMRLNIRLMGLLYGIMVIGMIGYHLMYSARYSSRRNNQGGGIVFLGLGLAAIGYGGTFFGNLIKAAVSRQREFLADASAVQFTRNPDGIAGALKKIGGHGSHINSVDVSEVSHMLFGEGQSAGFTGMFATHPPLEERIRRIDPQWQAQASGSRRASATRRAAATSTKSMGEAAAVTSGFSAGSGDALVDSIGNPGQAHIAQACAILAQIPVGLREEAHATLGACALVQALLIDSADADMARKQVEILASTSPAAWFDAFQQVEQQVRQLPRETYLPLVELALPALKQLSRPQYLRFMSQLSQLMAADGRITLFEWSLFKILRYNLDPPPLKSQNAKLEELNKSCEVLLSALAGAGQVATSERQHAFARGAEALGLPGLVFQEALVENIEALDHAVDQLRQLRPLQMPRLLKAMVACIEADGHILPQEGEVLRAVASLLDCPMPPLLPDRPRD